jgi:hypothetical protein
MAIDHSLTPDRLVLSAAEAEAQCGCADHDRFAGELSDTLDDRTIRYVLETRPHFEDLRHAVGQVAGMLVLAAAGSKTVTQDHPLFAVARTTLERVSDGIAAAHPSGRAVHHHRHLVAAAGGLGLALKRAREDLHLHGIDRARVDPVLELLHGAYRNLAWAAQALPGFELISFDQACCAPQQPGRPLN